MEINTYDLLFLLAFGSRAHPSSQSPEVAYAEEKARRKARLAAKEAETNKLLVKKLTKESAGLRRKNEQLGKELDKTINELAESRSQAKHSRLHGKRK